MLVGGKPAVAHRRMTAGKCERNEGLKIPIRQRPSNNCSGKIHRRMTKPGGKSLSRSRRSAVSAYLTQDIYQLQRKQELCSGDSRQTPPSQVVTVTRGDRWLPWRSVGYNIPRRHNSISACSREKLVTQP